MDTTAQQRAQEEEQRLEDERLRIEYERRRAEEVRVNLFCLFYQQFVVTLCPRYRGNFTLEPPFI